MNQNIEIIELDQADSTNNRIRQLAEDGQARNMTVVTAQYQTAGRGQVGNSWESEAGKNLLMSVLVEHRDLDVHQQFYFSKAVSVSLVETLDGIVKDTRIKWPNDIYHADRKLAGILIENDLCRSEIRRSIVGIGLNVNQTRFVSDAPNPVSLRQITGRDHDMREIVGTFVGNLQRWKSCVDEKDFASIDRQYFARLYRNVGMHAFADSRGRFMARIEGIAPEGFLVLRDADDVQRSYAFKEVEFII